MRRAGTAGIWLGLALLSASTGTAQCRPSGRKPFAAGLEALNQNDLPGAAKAFYQLVEAQPRCPEARNNLAVVFVEQGRLDEAAEQLRQALQVDPKYRRARVNLDRVEGLRAAARSSPPEGRPDTEPQTPTAAEATPTSPAGEDSEQTALIETYQTQAAATPAGAAHPTTQTTDAPTADAQFSGPPPPEGTVAPKRIATISSRANTTACVIEPGQKRLCVYEQTATAIASSECYPIALAQVRSWPRWIVASEVSPKRIRLLDETGQTRLEIVAPDAVVSGDAVRVQRSDLEALATRVVPWRTGWLIVE